VNKPVILLMATEKRVVPWIDKYTITFSNHFHF